MVLIPHLNKYSLYRASPLGEPVPFIIKNIVMSGAMQFCGCQK